MWQKMWHLLRGHSSRGDTFQPLYKLEQLAGLSRLPVIQVRAFIADRGETANGLPGPGVGGILASLLRRDLTFTRRVSVTGGEDSGYLAPAARSAASHDEMLTNGADSNSVIVGYLQSNDPARIELRIRLFPRRGKEGSDGDLVVPITPGRLTALSPSIAKKVAERLDLAITADVAQRWQQHIPTSWEGLLRAGRCWEQRDWRGIVRLIEAGEIHPDALAPLSDDTPDSQASRRGLELANAQEPDNPQLAFNRFCSIWNGNERPAPHLEAILRAGLAAGPGHGKSHMVLPHILVLNKQNVPFILAHSEVAYRLLRNNSFALANFSQYLGQLAPQDERILSIVFETIELDPDNPSGYVNAVDALLKGKRPADALKVAESLLELCTPPLSDRTMYCFRQNPAGAAAIDRGEFDPHQFAIEFLKRTHSLARGQ
ncbi:MAG TPA: hypothetical protein VGG64_19675 [Pirellulales bacterium]|jgi:hypothetical protein